MIGIDMELPKGCMVCPIKDSCKSIKEHQDEYNKFLEYYTGYDNRFAWCNLIDLGKEDMSWEELVEKVKELLIKIHIELETFSLKDYNIKFYKNGHIGVYYDGNYITFITNDGKTNYYQMYQIIKSLVGDQK